MTTQWTNAAADLRSLETAGPLAHCLTNVVAAGFTANVLLSLGASPVMVENVEEAAEVAGAADGVLANLGTLSPERDAALRAAASGARVASTPWVLDPVGSGLSAYRTKLAADLLVEQPAVVRGNASEVLSLVGADGAAGKGVDSLADSAEAVDAARTFAASRGFVVAVSGPTDYITDGQQVVEVSGGDPLMARVTGSGCALGATMAAMLPVVDSPLRAAVSASRAFAEAGERAARACEGPGSFAVGFLDALHGLGTQREPGTQRGPEEERR
ncbi:hydroxyethylthiazole kinase [Parasphingorhabdus pacifica]